MKLDPVKVEWMVRQKEKGTSNQTIADSMQVSPRWVRELWRRYRDTGGIPELGKPGRRHVETTEEEKNTILEAHMEYETGAVMLERIIDSCGTHIPHNRIRLVLKKMGLARDEPRKQLRRRWVRFERRYSNSMWHTDWTLIEGKGWMIAYLDDASRFVTG